MAALTNVLLYSKDGQQLYRAPLETRYMAIEGYDFHPDGRLVLIVHYPINDYRVEIETFPGSYKFDTLIKFARAPGVNYYRGLWVGPTGNDAVVEAVSGQPLSISGLRYREALAHYFKLFEDIGETDLFLYTDESRLNSPAFSPDGQYIMVTEAHT